MNLKAKILNTKSLRPQQEGQEAFNNKDEEVKKSAKNDRGAFVEMLAGKAEWAAPRCDRVVGHKILKFQENQPVCSCKGQRSEEPLNRVGGQARWMQHYHEGPTPGPEHPATHIC